MRTTTTDLEPAREHTDLGLDEERAKTDVALQRAVSAEDKLVDDELEASRAQADDQMQARRDRSDALLRENQKASPLQSDALDDERALAAHQRERERTLSDSLVEGERQRLDKAILLEREERQAVDEGIEIERAVTDDRLRSEREKTDEVFEVASALLCNEQAAHALSVTAVSRRDELLALVSHELLSPLTSITLNAQALFEPTAVPRGKEANLQVVEDIQAACAQMARLIGDLLDVASMDAGRLKVTLAPGDAGRLIREALAASAPMFKRHELTVTEDVTGHPLDARFDHRRLLQVFANLFANAVKFTPRGGSIAVSLAKVGPMLRFCVANSGPGIAPADMPHVFDRFWQVKQSDRRSLGLGLYICKAIVAAHGGTIWASSEAGQGSRFFVALPEDGLPVASAPT